ncbi:MAG: transposase [bacterium]
MSHKHSAPFEKGRFYHIYNRGNNKERIFFNEENYRYFLVKFDEYLSDFLDVYVFCLLLNHFHFLIRIKEDLPGFQNLEGLEQLHRCPIIQAYSNFFNAYTKAINKQEHRVGSLFQKNFKRILIDEEKYLLQMIYYIHNNPVHHNICPSLEEYKWSSYMKILNKRPSKLMKKEVIDIFGDEQGYIEFHQRCRIDFRGCENYLIDEK